MGVAYIANGGEEERVWVTGGKDGKKKTSRKTMT
jgi:hypothetical protein